MKWISKLAAALVTVLWAGSVWASPYAVEVVDSGGPFGPGPYDDPESALGSPALDMVYMGGTVATVKLVEPAFNYDSSGNKSIVTLNSGSYITVKFDHQVIDDPNNPYGVDFLVFGNSFYTGRGWVTNYTNMNEYQLAGGGWFEDVTVSVSQDGQNWYTYENGPYGDNAFPTQAYAWNPDQAQSTGEAQAAGETNTGWTDTVMDFTKPVDPSLADVLNGGGITAAEAIAMYDGSGGGTGFDLAESGLEWIQYIRVEGAGGEIDAFADVAPVPVPGTGLLLVTGLLIALRLRRSIHDGKK